MSEASTNPPEYYIGIMSGTSLDGVDLAIVECDQNQLSTHFTQFSLFPEQLQKDLAELTLAEQWHPDHYFKIETELTQVYANAVEAALVSARVEPGNITAIGCHGQTVRHRAFTKPAYTVQMINGSLLAELTNCTVVTDFRRRDMAAGGQGAPLAPAFHYAALSAQHPNAAVLNLGGIANLTIWDQERLIGFDSGPANGLTDAWMQTRFNKPRDEGGEQARQGNINQGLLEQLLKHPYLQLPAPKSTGREEFNLPWLESQLASYNDVSDQDVLTTLAEFTAVSIAESLKNSKPTHMYVCGGGVNNLYILERLQRLIPQTVIAPSSEVGVDPDFMEAIAFAWIARQTIHLQPGNQPSVTGAHGPRILGAIYPR
ncbi:anhydro-N-acetylmuramic acid kinase [Hahella ganghwensis]|uniref:anhydro-N-acetylmuramic acid kinase n=1 Tax=Hahella ganghwensis TaxID=286420 RepID=UPI00036A681F|nr:anhydro-N-acetylmuramic acid kinase [Hahella ganghwensis]